MTKVFFLLSLLRQLLTALMLCVAMDVNATETILERSTKLESEVLTFLQTYPIRRIDSVASAENAIADGEKLQTNIQSLTTESESACYERFLVNACIDDVRHLRRKLQDQVRRVTIEAKAYLRHQRGAKLPRDASEPVV